VRARLKSFLASESEVDSAGNVFKICSLFELHYLTTKGCASVCVSLYQIEMDNNKYQIEQMPTFQEREQVSTKKVVSTHKQKLPHHNHV
jgi:hypothetical protein